MADPAKYLLPTERPVINIRRHWAVLVGRGLQSLLLLIIGVLAARAFADFDFAQTVAIWFCVLVALRWIWIIADWYVEKLVVTDKRVLLLTGIVTRKVAIMPLVKVTDLTYNRSTTGLMLGYGQFVVETAGQDQALSRIDFVPKPEKLYIQISELLFGGDKGSPGALVTAAQREAEQEADRLARRRWRRFARRRRSGAEDRPVAAASTPTASQLDAILTDRDTLLADRDDPEWGRGYRDDGDEWDYGRDRGDRDDEDERDRGGRGRGDDLGWDPQRGDGLGDDGDDGDYRGPEPTVELPRFHEPRRGGGLRDDDLRAPDVALPPRRRRDDSPPDPADD